MERRDRLQEFEDDERDIRSAATVLVIPAVVIGLITVAAAFAQPFIW